MSPIGIHTYKQFEEQYKRKYYLETKTKQIIKNYIFCSVIQNCMANVMTGCFNRSKMYTNSMMIFFYLFSKPLQSLLRQ